MSVLIDTNVLLDVALMREPHVRASALALSKARSQGITLLCATSVTTLHYFLRQKLGEKGARQFLAQCASAMRVAPVNAAVLRAALDCAMTDFEDGVIAHSALHSNASLILTRNPKDFEHSPVPAVNPDDYLSPP